MNVSIPEERDVSKAGKFVMRLYMFTYLVIEASQIAVSDDFEAVGAGEFERSVRLTVVLDPLLEHEIAHL